jgi:phenylalanyl-tRNA synthetase alpha chain
MADTVPAMDAQAYEAEALAAVAAASTPEELDDARVRYLGRSSELKLALRGVREREAGMALNAVRERLEAAVAEREEKLRRAELERALAEDAVDVTLPGREPRRGHMHLITQIRREVEDIFLGMGYEVVDGREIETAEYLFDALNMPAGHPTRSPHHSIFLNGDVVLRTETSPSQIHTMQAKPPPIYMVSLGRVYRRDTVDATHYPIFHQVEGLAVDEGITLGDLKGTLRHLLHQLFGDVEARFVTHYFPFTEPSCEVLISCFVCGKQGCPTCRYSGWIEVGGSGVVDPNVLRWVGYDPEQVSGFAFGWGLERIAQLRHGIRDIRLIWNNDLRFLRQF